LIKESTVMLSLPKRSEIQAGMRVQIVEKQNQATGRLTEGIVARLLTSSPTHPHGIKVMLTDGKVGRVQALVGAALPPAA
jgi:uncharacterized repeat protein (TIGR03833 family)